MNNLDYNNTEDLKNRHYEALAQQQESEEYKDSFFNRDSLDSYSQTFADYYQTRKPYPYISFVNMIPDLIADEVYKAFPEPDQLEYYKYDNPLEKKYAFDRIHRMPSPIREVFNQLASPLFLNFLEKLTGVKGLIPDPYLRGGGLHTTTRGGKLDIHVDFNRHPKLYLERRLNVIIFLNRDWQEEWNGDFQIWEGFKDSNDKHHLLKLHEKIYPHFNTFLCFNTSDNSYHGFPERLKCPNNITRKSLAMYYYTAESSEERGSSSNHSTIYVKRPNDAVDSEMDELRKSRAEGRLSSNIDSDITS